MDNNLVKNALFVNGTSSENVTLCEDVQNILITELYGTKKLNDISKSQAIINAFNNKKCIELSLTEKSSTLCKIYLNYIQRSIRKGGRFEKFPEWASYAASNCVLLAAIYHLSKYPDGKRRFISARAMQMAINTMRRFESHALCIFKNSKKENLK